MFCYVWVGVGVVDDGEMLVVVVLCVDGFYCLVEEFWFILEW